jgi:DNA-binding LacI/PurR family transcriptional regulator
VGEFTVDAGRAGLERLLDLPEPPTAVFAAGETLALGVLQEAKSRKIDVPESWRSPATPIPPPPRSSSHR